MKNIITIIFLSLLLNISTLGELRDQTQTKNRINSYLSKLEKVGFSGSVLIAVNGDKVLSEGYGFSNIELKHKNTSQTIFDIGSITKQFTAASILKLEMEGKLKTNDKISKYFNNVPKEKENITIHDLLRHQSGLPSNVGRDYEKITKEDFINKVMNSKLRFEVGTNFSYSNIGYSLLAIIVEYVSGISYESYLYNNLWQPAQMEHTGYTRPDFDNDLIATGYNRSGETWGKPTEKEWDETAPYWHLLGNGGILSTTEDLYKWDKTLLTESILSKQAKEKLYHPKIRENENPNSIYAYGWDVSLTDRNTWQVWHNGTNNIFYADLLRFIDEDIVIIMLSNKSHQNFDRLNRELAKMIFNSDYEPEIPIPDNKVNRDFTEQIINLINNYGLEKAKELYNKKSQDQDLLEFEMRRQGFDQIDNNNPGFAINIFKMNVFVFPNNAKALQGLGEGYMETGKKELAIKYFIESLKIEPNNPFVKDMVKKLNIEEQQPRTSL